MSDLISRQAAIEALHGYFDGMLETDTWSPCDVYGLIEVLPSAEPEIIRCEDCKYYNAEERLCNELMGFGRYWSKNDYCSFAERRDDE